MELIWQVEEGKVADRNSGRILPRRNILRLLKGSTWDGVCKFEEGKVKDFKDKELRVLAGPNNYLPGKLKDEEGGLLIINILQNDPTLKNQNSQNILIRLNSVDSISGKNAGEIITGIINCVKFEEKNKSSDILDLVYISKDTLDNINKIVGKRKNLQTVLRAFYKKDDKNEKVDEALRKLVRSMKNVCTGV